MHGLHTRAAPEPFCAEVGRVPTPTDEKFRAPGLALAAATRSPIVFHPLAGGTTMTFGDYASGMTAEKSRADGSSGSNIAMERSCARSSGRARCSHRDQPWRQSPCKGSACAGTVLHDDALAELRRELLEHHARDDVGGAPAAKGTMTRSGFVGQVSAVASMVARPNPSSDSSVRQNGFMTPSWSHRLLALGQCTALAQTVSSVQYIIPLAIHADPA